jgi:hypothetical protein
MAQTTSKTKAIDPKASQSAVLVMLTSLKLFSGKFRLRLA